MQKMFYINLSELVEDRTLGKIYIVRCKAHNCLSALGKVLHYCYISAIG